MTDTIINMCKNDGLENYLQTKKKIFFFFFFFVFVHPGDSVSLVGVGLHFRGSSHVCCWCSLESLRIPITCFYGEIWKIISILSSSTCHICSSPSNKIIAKLYVFIKIVLIIFFTVVTEKMLPFHLDLLVTIIGSELFIRMFIYCEPSL